MATHLYLSLIPESLIASMLPPEQFGYYYAVGPQARSRGQAIFFEIDRAKLPPDTDLPLGEIERRCVPHADGSPRKSSYLAVYRVLERVPLDALGRLHLVTDDGRVLSLSPGPLPDAKALRLHLYQEYCPLTPRVASRLDPVDFGRRITNPASPVSVPRIVFAELRLQKLAGDPASPEVDDLPYRNLEHLRDCLAQVAAGDDEGKITKLVVRQMAAETLYRTIRGGFYAADATGTKCWPMPTLDQLETEHYGWWRSALSTFGG